MIQRKNLFLYFLFVLFIIFPFFVQNANAQDEEDDIDIFSLLSGSTDKEIVLEEEAGGELIMSMQLNKTVLLVDDAIAYVNGDNYCFKLSTFANAIFFAIEVDKENQTANGWFIEEENSFVFDYKNINLEINKKQINFSKDDFIIIDNEPCINENKYQDLFPIKTEFIKKNSVYKITSLISLPVEEKMIRRKIYDELEDRKNVSNNDKNTIIDNRNIIATDYKYISKPDLRINSKFDYSSKNNINKSNINITSNFNLLKFATSVRVSLSNNKKNNRFSYYAQRISPYNDQLGFLQASRVEYGDIYMNLQNINEKSSVGRGFKFTNRAFQSSAIFDKVNIRGELFNGWEAELYRGKELLDYRLEPDEYGFYTFEDIDITKGLNNFTVKLYGPQGEKLEKNFPYLIGNEMISKNDFQYNFSLIQKDSTFAHIVNDFIGNDFFYDNQTKNTTDAIDDADPYQILFDMDYGLSKFITFSSTNFIETNNENTENYSSLNGIKTVLFGSNVSMFSYIKKHGSGKHISIQKKVNNNINFNINYSDLENIIDNLKNNEKKLKLSLRTSHNFLRKNLTSRLFYEVNEKDVKNTIISHSLSTDIYNTQVTNKVFLNNYENISGSLILAKNLNKLNVRANLTYNNNENKLEIIDTSVSLGYKFNSNNSVNLSLSQKNNKFQSYDLSWRKSFDEFALDFGYKKEKEHWSTSLNLSFILNARSHTNKYMPYANGSINNSRLMLKIYNDYDNDGIIDDDENYIDDFIIKFNNKNKKADAKKDGYLIFENIDADKLVKIAIDRKSIDNQALYIEDLSKKQFLFRPNAEHKIEIPAIPVGEIDGTIYLLENNKKEGLIGVELGVFNGDDLIAKKVSGYGGYYYFNNIPFGKYELRVIKAYDFDISNIKKEINLDIENDSFFDVDLLIKNDEE